MMQMPGSQWMFHSLKSSGFQMRRFSTSRSLRHWTYCLSWKDCGLTETLRSCTLWPPGSPSSAPWHSTVSPWMFKFVSSRYTTTWKKNQFCIKVSVAKSNSWKYCLLLKQSCVQLKYWSQFIIDCQFVTPCISFEYSWSIYGNLLSLKSALMGIITFYWSSTTSFLLFPHNTDLI